MEVLVARQVVVDDGRDLLALNQCVYFILALVLS